MHYERRYYYYYYIFYINLYICTKIYIAVLSVTKAGSIFHLHNLSRLYAPKWGKLTTHWSNFEDIQALFRSWTCYLDLTMQDRKVGLKVILNHIKRDIQNQILTSLWPQLCVKPLHQYLHLKKNICLAWAQSQPEKKHGFLSSVY